ncbi:hypothetical protein VP01_1037g2 [Puccinia sorghi]|uniref:Uncharacterized protein n=1 Tax=Puccinia sorghi TaxID=27349 RepID=A0A0L6VUJ7_9BASI|nr:hypothetical protein VP01_1037g2 [Puccinia sorghi]
MQTRSCLFIRLTRNHPHSFSPSFPALDLCVTYTHAHTHLYILFTSPAIFVISVLLIICLRERSSYISSTCVPQKGKQTEAHTQTSSQKRDREREGVRLSPSCLPRSQLLLMVRQAASTLVLLIGYSGPRPSPINATRRTQLYYGKCAHGPGDDGLLCFSKTLDNFSKSFFGPSYAFYMLFIRLATWRRPQFGLAKFTVYCHVDAGEDEPRETPQMEFAHPTTPRIVAGGNDPNAVNFGSWFQIWLLSYALGCRLTWDVGERKVMKKRKHTMIYATTECKLYPQHPPHFCLNLSNLQRPSAEADKMLVVCSQKSHHIVPLSLFLHAFSLVSSHHVTDLILMTQIFPFPSLSFFHLLHSLKSQFVFQVGWLLCSLVYSLLNSGACTLLVSSCAKTSMYANMWIMAAWLAHVACQLQAVAWSLLLLNKTKTHLVQAFQETKYLKKLISHRSIYGKMINILLCTTIELDKSRINLGIRDDGKTSSLATHIQHSIQIGFYSTMFHIANSVLKSLRGLRSGLKYSAICYGHWNQSPTRRFKNFHLLVVSWEFISTFSQTKIVVGATIHQPNDKKRGLGFQPPKIGSATPKSHDQILGVLATSAALHNPQKLVWKGNPMTPGSPRAPFTIMLWIHWSPTPNFHHQPPRKTQPTQPPAQKIAPENIEVFLNDRNKKKLMEERDSTTHLNPWSPWTETSQTPWIRSYTPPQATISTHHQSTTHIHNQQHSQPKRITPYTQAHESCRPMQSKLGKLVNFPYLSLLVAHMTEKCQTSADELRRNRDGERRRAEVGDKVIPDGEEKKDELNCMMSTKRDGKKETS